MRLLLTLGIILFSAFALMALTPISNEFDDPAVLTEFKNVYDNAQPLEFRVFNSTPQLSELRNGEVVIVSSGTFNKMIFKANQDIFSINVSCITINR